MGYERLRAHLETHPIQIPTDSDTPARDELWRATWDNDSVNIYIQDTTDTAVTALIASTSPNLVPNPRFVLTADESPLGYDTAIWNDPSLELPMYVLDGRYGRIPDLAPEGATSMMLPGDDQTLDGYLADTQRDLPMQLRRLANAQWIPQHRPVGPLRDFARTRAISASQLGEQIGFTAHPLRLILDGSWWLDSATAAAVAEILGTSPQELPTGDPFAAAHQLPTALNSPRRKTALLRRAKRNDTTEAATRVDTALDLLLARTRPAAPAPDELAVWNHLLDTYLAD